MEGSAFKSRSDHHILSVLLVVRGIDGAHHELHKPQLGTQDLRKTIVVCRNSAV